MVSQRVFHIDIEGLRHVCSAAMDQGRCRQSEGRLAGDHHGRTTRCAQVTPITVFLCGYGMLWVLTKMLIPGDRLVPKPGRFPFFDATRWCSGFMPGFKVWAQPGACCRGGLSHGKDWNLSSHPWLWFLQHSAPTSKCQDGALAHDSKRDKFLVPQLNFPTEKHVTSVATKATDGSQYMMQLNAETLKQEPWIELERTDWWMVNWWCGLISLSNWLLKQPTIGVQMAMMKWVHTADGVVWRCGRSHETGDFTGDFSTKRYVWTGGAMITSWGREKGRDLHGPWSARNERVGVRGGDAGRDCPVAKTASSKMVDVSRWFHDGFCLFGQFWTFSSLFLFGDRPKIAKWPRQDFADQGSVLLLVRGGRIYCFRWAISNLYCGMGPSEGARQNLKCICFWWKPRFTGGHPQNSFL